MENRPPADLSRTWAIVPIRGIETAKTRLGADLDAEERADLVTRLLDRTLEATRQATGLAGTIVVTIDPAAAAVAARHGAVALIERVPGLNGAIEAARSLAVAREATAVLVLPADIPGIGAAAIDAVLQAAATAMGGARDARGIVGVVADHHGEGTNALLLSPPEVIAPAFGATSRARHAAATRRAGARYLEVGGPLSLDVDTPADLILAEATIGPIDG